MEKFLLCKFCFPRFRKKDAAIAAAASGTDCFVCRGASRLLRPLVESAVQQSSQFEWKTFAVSTSVPREMLLREEKIADCLPPGSFTSLKNSINASAISAIASATGKKKSQRFADAIFSLNFTSNSSFAKPTPVYIFGHYIKLSRRHCQSRWHCSECGGKGCSSCGGSGQNYPSVEEELGKVLQPLFGATSATLHACGREDVDVRMLGNGRPFVCELKHPRKRSADLQGAEGKFASNPDVRAINLRHALPFFIDAVCNSHFDKEYSALVSADRPLTEADAKKAESLSGTMLFQQTPVRVLGRRSDMERKRKVFRIAATCEKGGKLRLSILAEAGTYIKELIHGDEGRTRPSISETFRCKAVCEELDVAGIHDFFLETVPIPTD